MGFLNLIGGFKTLGILAIIIALGGYIWKIKHDASTEHVQLLAVTAQRDAAGIARDVAIAANATNLETINQLNEEKQATNSALNNLAAARAKDQVTIGSLRSSIKSQSNNPLNQTKLSPVLSDTIRSIQLERTKRSQPTVKVN